MVFFKVLSLVIFIGIGMMRPADAIPILWSSGAGGNDHYYEFLPGSFSWDAGIAEASTRTHLGLQGYAATITSVSENAFISSAFRSNTTAWIGGNDVASEGVFVWADGPEANQALQYFNWRPPNPNGGRGENYVALHLSDGRWGDGPLNATNVVGIIVEYSGSSTSNPVPEPTTMLLFGVGLLGLAGISRKKIQ